MAGKSALRDFALVWVRNMGYCDSWWYGFYHEYELGLAFGDGYFCAFIGSLVNKYVDWGD